MNFPAVFLNGLFLLTSHSASLPAPLPLEDNPNAALHEYRVAVDKALTRMDVEACFVDSLPHHFLADDPLARQALLEASIILDGERQRVDPGAGALRFPIPSDDNCLRYRIDLEKLTRGQRLNRAYRLPNTLLLAPATWLWRPWSTGGRGIAFDFRLPDGMAVSVPWKPVDSGPGHQHFVMEEDLFEWPALMAIGELLQDEIELPDAKLHLSMLPGPANASLAQARRWLKPAALAVSTLHGGFPQPDVQLLVIPMENGRDAAPWAQVTRGGGPAVQFYMNAAADWPVFRDDWIATHEMSHLALPFVSRRDKWFSEGIASYFQNILRARVGLLSEKEAWQAMADGFHRGRGGIDERNLRDAAINTRSRERYMRVYWSGAAIAMLGDIAVRKRTDNRWSLERLLAEFRECCDVAGKTWRAREVLAQFDRMAGVDVFLPLHEEHVYSRFFPRTEPAWNALGIRLEAGRVHLDTKTAQQEALRRSIMSPEPTGITGE